ncbi:MAG: glycerol-3-phosphate dehydrogenase [Hyphomicrobiales bacterium]|nr:MAG: glycerol-3-phosphate dehydrogenase [Hyphomicrobiales bacterium]
MPLTANTSPSTAHAAKADVSELGVSEPNIVEPGYDVFVIGGGINGVGIARDAAGRGYSVALAEMNDLASGTSSGSTKLIHGGLRYLEHFEFRLVREALMERETLWAMAPHIIWPMRFVLPHHADTRPAWLLRIGLFLYDHIGGRSKLPGTSTVNLTSDPAGKPLKSHFKKAFEYSDCWVNDARLVVLNARDAADRGANIMTRTKVQSLQRISDHWEIGLEDQSSGRSWSVTARCVINAAGPWVDKILTGALGRNDVHNVRLVQGSHIVIHRKFEDPRAYFFQNNDGRIFFAIPYEQDFTLIGTTDRDYDGNPENIAITPQETEYLLDAATEYFEEPVSAQDIVWSYSGVRPLYDDGASKAQEATRDYVLKVDGATNEPKLINIFGGKITTYRRLAESMLEKIGDAIGTKGAPWTKTAHLPGGDFEAEDFDKLVAKLMQDCPVITQRHAWRLVRLYGTRAWQAIGHAKTMLDLGLFFGTDLCAAEVRYLQDQEWAHTAEDILWRRTKRGLLASARDTEKLQAFLNTQHANSAK